MTVCGSTYNQTSNCCATSAAAYSSARVSEILDTVGLLAVSIFVCLVSIRLRML